MSETKKKIRYLKAEGETVDRMLRIPKSSYEQLMEEAKARGLSGSSLMREALNLYLQRNPETKIETLLTDCTTKDDFEQKEGFEIEGENGFLAQVSKRKLVGKVWTNTQLDKYAEKLIIGHDNYLFPPTYKELLKRNAEAMQLNEEQKAYFTKKIEELVPKAREKEEDW